MSKTRRSPNEVGGGTYSFRKLCEEHKGAVNYINPISKEDGLYIVGRKITNSTNMHHILADNPMVDFENDKWVLKNTNGNRYNKAIQQSRNFLDDFATKIKSKDK